MKTLLIVLIGISSVANANSNVTVIITEETLNNYLTHRVPYEDVIAADSGKFLFVPWSYTLYGKISRATINISKDKVRLKAEAQVWMKGFSDAETLNTECEVKMIDNKLHITPKQMLWNMNIDPGGYTGKIDLGTFNFLNVAPKIREGIVIELEKLVDKKVEGIPVKATNYTIELKENEIYLFSEFDVVPKQ